VTTTAGHIELQCWLHSDYASQHIGDNASSVAGLAYRPDVLPRLPLPSAGRGIDLGCGHGEPVRLLLTDGYDTEATEISPEQVAQARTGGVFAARVPNAVRALGGQARYEDFTREPFSTVRSVRHAAAAGLYSVTVRPCAQVLHGLISAIEVGHGGQSTPCASWPSPPKLQWSENIT
jgi:SAM-dependent methyltransferase